MASKLSGVIYVFSTALLSGAVTLLSLAAAKRLPVADYVLLVYLQAAATLGSALIDFGLDAACMRLGAEFGVDRVYRPALGLKVVAALFSVGVLIATLLLGSNVGGIGLVCAGGAALSLSLSTRRYLTQRGSTRAIAASTVVGVLVVGGGGFVFLERASVIGLGISIWVLGSFASAIIALWIVAAESTESRRGFCFWHDKATLCQLGRVSGPLWLSALSFSAGLPIATIILRHTLTPLEYGGLGIALTVAGALGMLTTATRLVLFSDFYRRAAGSERETSLASFSWSMRNEVFLYCVIYGLCIALAVFAVASYYEDRFPGAASATASLSLLLGVTSALGLINIRTQAHNLFWHEVLVNVMRMIALIALLEFAVVATATHAALAIGAVYASGEVLYLCYGNTIIAHRRRRATA